jgi:hypothetical protein
MISRINELSGIDDFYDMSVTFEEILGWSEKMAARIVLYTTQMNESMTENKLKKD